MKAFSLDKQGIYEYQQNREPYLLIDYASEIIPGVSAKGYKDLKNFLFQKCAAKRGIKYISIF